MLSKRFSGETSVGPNTRHRFFLGPALTAALGAAVAAQDITGADLLTGVSDPTRWLSVYGDYSAQHHSPLTQITPSNASQLRPEWTFQSGVTASSRRRRSSSTASCTSPAPRIMRGRSTAGPARRSWHYQRPLPDGLKVCCGPVNRGFAIYHDRLFMTTLDAHLIALEMKTGKVIWDVELADYKLGYASTVAPLVVKDKLIVGIAGGEYANRGFLDAYDPTTASASGASGPFRRRASRAVKPGRRTCSSAAARRRG